MLFHIVTFGCQMNVHDSDWLIRALTARGHEQTAEKQAEVFIINTCSVREKPEQKVYSELGRLRCLYEKNPGFFVAVCGCVAQQLGKELLQRFPFVRLVCGTDGLAQAPDALEQLYNEPQAQFLLTDFVTQWKEREQAWPMTQKSPVSGFVNIMQGCDNFCTYCIVPFVRGRQKSRTPEAVLEECKKLLALGVKEITLLGQNVNSYGLDSHCCSLSFADLLYKVSALPGLERLRFTTSHPKDIAPEVIRAFGELENLCPHLHLPLQSGADSVLKRMGRKYDTARYLDIVAALRQVRSDIAFGTDLIVAFPGESEDEFLQTLEMMEQVGFENSFSFKYSDRPGTAAQRMPNKVDPAVAQQRLLSLQDLQNTITKKSLQNCVNRKSMVLIEGKSRVQSGDRVFWQGRDPQMRIVHVGYDGVEDLSGLLLDTEIVQAKKHCLLGIARGCHGGNAHSGVRSGHQ